MKTCLTVCASLLLIFAAARPSAAQVHPRAGVDLGAATTYLTIPKDSGLERKSGPGVHVGGFFVTPLPMSAGLQPGITFERRRSEAAGITRETDYLTIPVLIRMNFLWGMHVAEGLAYYIPLKTTQTAGGVETDVTDNAQHDISLIIALGKRFGHFGVEGRWNSGFRQVQKTLGTGEYPVRNRAITGVFTLTFGEF
jgi:hypothetical protein